MERTAINEDVLAINRQAMAVVTDSLGMQKRPRIGFGGDSARQGGCSDNRQEQ
jgi:hypothetical protein